MLVFLVSCGGGKVKGGGEITPEGEYELVWADEFEYEGLPDAESWSMEVWGPGQVNGELQSYTADPANVDVRNGVLRINLRKEEDGRVTSARVISAGKRTFTYGRFEIRARLPQGRGTWPAIWMLGQSIMEGTSWPECGEIDIMEHVGYDPGRVHASVHTRDRNHVIGTQATGSTYESSFATAFHVYECEWTPAGISISVDGKQYFSYVPTSYTVEEWPFGEPAFLLLNVAWGGGWGGAQGVDEGVLPQTMEVDYVRVYQRR